MTLYNIRERWLDEDEDDEDDEDNPDENDLGNFQSDSDSESDDTGYDDPLHSAAIRFDSSIKMKVLFHPTNNYSGCKWTFPNNIKIF